MEQHRAHASADRPRAEPLVAGEWLPAEVWGWFADGHGVWRAQVRYWPEPGEVVLTMVAADRVREPRR